MRALTEPWPPRPNIRTLENHVAINLLGRNSERGAKRGSCWGVYALDRNTHQIRKVIRRATIACTGGAGKVISTSTNPDIASGDERRDWHNRAGARRRESRVLPISSDLPYHPAAKSF